MSNEVNTQLLERAAELIDWIQLKARANELKEWLINAPDRADIRIEQALDRGDYEDLWHLVTKYEAIRAEYEMHANNILEPTDTF